MPHIKLTRLNGLLMTRRRATSGVALALAGGLAAGVLTACGTSGPSVVVVPAAQRSLFVVAARRCPGVLTPASLAAQAEVETGFDPSRDSPAGAEGLMQITPAIWRIYGTDANGDGVANPYTAADSVATAAKYNCALARTLRDLPGDPTTLRLAAYNAGPNAVRRYGGTPPFPETRHYVSSVLTWTARFAPQFAPSPSPSPSG
ncbi:MAG: lytic transglycosylase domain-containing protein [Frankia sp.]